MSGRKNAIGNLLANGQDSQGVAVVTAHPDDESIGAGSRLPFLRGANFICLTDGVPQNPQDAIAAGFRNRDDYARARRSELHAALSLAGISPRRVLPLRLADQEVSFHLAETTLILLKLFLRLQPAHILTHAYEGGHPDHDATAFAVHAACELAEARHGWRPEVIEMACYHNRGGCLTANKFPLKSSGDVVELPLSRAEREFKQCLFACHSTQWNVLRWFPVERERFRAAPQYDFTRPPHPGRLYYEMFDWGITGERWRSLAANARCELHLERNLRFA